MKIENRTVKNLRVVVMMDSTRGEKLLNINIIIIPDAVEDKHLTNHTQRTQGQQMLDDGRVLGNVLEETEYLVRYDCIG